MHSCSPPPWSLMTPELFPESKTVQKDGRAPKTLVQQVHHPAAVSIACW